MARVKNNVLAAALIAVLFPGASLALPKDYRAAVPAPDGVVRAIERDFYHKRWPAMIKSYISLFLKVPRQKPFAWEGALWLYQPSTLTFEAVDDFGNTQFYFRHTYDRGWIVEYGARSKRVALPVDGRTMVALLMGRPPALPQSLFHIPGADGVTLVDDHNAWTFSRESLPVAFRHIGSSARKSYTVTWKDWREKNGARFPNSVDFHSRNGRLQFKITHRDIELK